MGGWRRLAAILEAQVPRPLKPKRRLEQYRTPPELALQLVAAAEASAQQGCSIVLDLGAGTGMITYAAALTCCYSVGLEVDLDRLLEAKSSSLYGSAVADFVQGDVLQPPLRRCPRRCCIVMNPPFGVVNRGADTAFLRVAAALGPDAIASLHLASSGLDFLRRVYEALGYQVVGYGEYRFPIPQLYERHVKRIHYTRVLLVAARRR